MIECESCRDPDARGRAAGVLGKLRVVSMEGSQDRLVGSTRLYSVSLQLLAKAAANGRQPGVFLA
jgi:hypothetical protein